MRSGGGAPESRVYYSAPEGDPLRAVLRPMTISQGVTLPGHFRPTKKWDLMVYAPNRSHPNVAVELKSQNGPSYGNNANNRAEEATG